MNPHPPSLFCPCGACELAHVAALGAVAIRPRRVLPPPVPLDAETAASADRAIDVLLGGLKRGVRS